MEKGSGEGNMDGGLQLQLEEDGGSRSRQNCMESSGLWPVLHWQQHAINQVSQNVISNRLHGQNSLSVPEKNSLLINW